MSRRETAALALAVAVSAAAAIASETITYSYDARGRLIRAVRTGSVNNNVATNYSYDKARAQDEDPRHDLAATPRQAAISDGDRNNVL